MMMENAMLRQQLIVLRRQAKRPQLTKTDRVLLVLLAGRLHSWKSALDIVEPDTLLRWHRQGFRLFWKSKSKCASLKPKLPAETIEQIRQMAQANRLGGAERIRGELLKLDMRVQFLTSVQAGIDAYNAGDTVDHAEVVKMFADMDEADKAANA